MNIQGSMVALVTPFTNGEVDYDTLKTLIEFQIANGTQGLVPCGTTGESPTLSHSEHDRVVEFTVEVAAGRVPVVAGAGSNNTAEAARLTRHAKDVGADACLIINPYYNRPTQQGIFEHVATLGEIGLPIVLYNHPGRTGVMLQTETIVRMFNEIEMVTALKDATGSLDHASSVAHGCDIAIISGDDSLTLPLCSIGGTGVISVLANILPAEMRKLVDLASAGDIAAAREQHFKLFDLFKAMNAEVNPIPVKTAMAMAGMVKEEFRLPMIPLSEQYRKPMAELLRAAGVQLKA